MSNKRQNGWTDLAQILGGTSRGRSDFKYVILKYLYEIRKLKFFFILYKEKMLRDKAKLKVEREDGGEAP